MHPACDMFDPSLGGDRIPSIQLCLNQGPLKIGDSTAWPDQGSGSLYE